MDINIYKLLLKVSSNGDSHENNSLAKIILSRDFYNQESKMPELFVLLEIDRQKSENAKDAAVLLDRIEIKIIERLQKIYNSISSRKSFQTDNLSENLLELILKSLNSEILFCLEECNLAYLKKAINIFIGILEPAILKNEIKFYFHFSCCNNVEAFLFFPQNDKYKIMDIKQGESDDSADENKIFTNITSGQLDNNSYLAICNKNLIDHVIIDKLKQIIISMEEKEAVKYLKNILSEADTESEFISIFISLSKEEKKSRLSPENSIEKLMITERNTEKFLTPSILPDFKNNFKNFALFIKKAASGIYRKILRYRGKILKLQISGQKTEKNLSEYKNRTLHKVKTFRQAADKLKTCGRKFIDYVLRAIGLVADAGRKVILASFGKAASIVKRIIKMSFLTKAIALVFILAILFFWKGTEWLKNTRIKEAREIVYNEALVELEKKFNSLEADLIYDNFEKASLTLREIDNIMETTLAANIVEYREKYEELSAKISDYKKEVNKIAEIKNIKLITPELDDCNISNIALNNKNLFLADAANNKIVEFETQKNTTETWNAEEKLENFLYYSKSKNGITAYEKEKNKVYEIVGAKIKEIKAIVNGGIKDVKKYADSVYVLDAQNNQIYVYRYARRESWIKDSQIEIKNAIGMAIDGNVFVLHENGEVSKFFKGHKEKFSLPEIEPPLNAPSKFFTDSDAKNLYILDPPNNRILQFKKDCDNSKCSLLAQYTSEKFTELRDFSVDEASRVIYVLNGQELFKFEI